MVKPGKGIRYRRFQDTGSKSEAEGWTDAQVSRAFNSLSVCPCARANVPLQTLNRRKPSFTLTFSYSRVHIMIATTASLQNRPRRYLTKRLCTSTLLAFYYLWKWWSFKQRVFFSFSCPSRYVHHMLRRASDMVLCIWF